MNNKNRKTYCKLYQTPTPSDIKWKEIEDMLEAFGAEISEGSGSRVRVKLNGERAVFHRPHPEKVTDRGAVKSLQCFLKNAGITNDEV